MKAGASLSSTDDVELSIEMDEKEVLCMMEEMKAAILNAEDLNTQYEYSDEPSAYDTPEEVETNIRGEEADTPGKCNTIMPEQGACGQNCHQYSTKQSKEVKQIVLEPRFLLSRKIRKLVSMDSKSLPEPNMEPNGGNVKGAAASNRVVPEPGIKQLETFEVKSLTLAIEAIPRPRGNTMNFDTVAVGFWIAELREGCYLSKLRYPGDKYGKRRKYTVLIDRDGLVAIRWRRMSVLGITDHRADLVSTEIQNADLWEFRMDTSVGEIFA